MRVRQLALVARDLAAVVDDLTAVLGIEVSYNDPGVEVFGLHNAVMPIGRQFLEVVSPSRADSSAARYLDRRRGDCGYMVILQSPDLDTDRKRLGELGVRVVWETSFPDIATIHLHPRDVGGAILSLDRSDPPESWRWAGPSWQSKVHTEVIGAIKGARMAVVDPDAVGGRWAAVTGSSLERDGRRRLIELDVGRLVFERCDDANDEGLVGIELEVNDRERLKAAARKRGLAVTDAAVTICGTHFYLN
jgi:hypothetical protein